ncbi:MAG: FAD-dependent oxidoreductase [Planctomycetaceae bacterium]
MASGIVAALVVAHAIRPVAGVETQAAATQGVVHDDFDVVVAGGSTAAFAAALAAAESGARTALIEPTDWLGGQLTSSGVPAVDEAWHTIKPADGPPYSVAAVARTPANITPSFHALMRAIENPANCWVSRFCFCPDAFVVGQLEPLRRAAGDRLTVFLETVVKRVEAAEDGRSITAMECIARSPRPGVADRGYDRLPSADLADWYSPRDSDRFTKRSIRFASALRPGRKTVFIDATEWGEMLALSGRPYLQGVESEDGGLECRDTCGQATVYCFAQELHAEPVIEADREVAAAELGYGAYGDKPDAWTKIWTYRRIRGRAATPAAGDVCLQNWGYSEKHREGGNDYPFAYLFLPREQAAAERADWRGGIHLPALRGAEDRAYGWHQWFRRHAGDAGLDSARISLCPAVLGTGHGLAKLPYIRDTRRAIGLDGFVLRFADLTGPAAQKTGTVFPDRVALGAYPADIHPIAGCEMPAYCRAAHDTLPFCIPFRALTHRDFGNLLVVGKTMAQSFLANSATRLHPIEWSSGTAGGVAAAHMARTGRTSREALAAIGELQEEIRVKTPIDWTIPQH